MKKNYLVSLTLLTVCVLFCSCSYRVFPTEALEYNYDMTMQSKSELEKKSKVRIFNSEQDVKGQYELIAYVQYDPFISIPIIYSKYSQQKKKFYKKAVLKANQLGGNGIIVSTVGHFKVINITDWDSDSESASVYTNPIFSRKYLDKFKSGAVQQEPERQQKRDVQAFTQEITNNVKNIKTQEELDFVDEKILVFKEYNESLKRPDKDILDLIHLYNTKLRKVVVKRIERIEKGHEF